MTKREFERRLSRAQEFERKVKAELDVRGWLAEPFGQGQLSEQMRDVIKRIRTPVRYMPDLIAAKRFTATTRVVFVDAKDGDRWRDTGNHDVETAALAAAHKWEDLSECPFYFVFSDAGVATPALITEIGKPGQYRGVGSGTPFLVFSAVACATFNSVFGHRDEWTEAA